MHRIRLPAQAHPRPRGERHLTGRAHEERFVADAGRHDRVRAMVFGTDHRSWNTALVYEANVLRPDAERQPRAAPREHRLARPTDYRA
jgi:hypothetical protein